MAKFLKSQVTNNKEKFNQHWLNEYKINKSFVLLWEILKILFFQDSNGVIVLNQFSEQAIMKD